MEPFLIKSVMDFPYRLFVIPIHQLEVEYVWCSTIGISSGDTNNEKYFHSNMEN